MLAALDLGWISSIFLMLFFFGFCIFIHEFGHLLAAIWRGLHVERFSVGFGHAIKQWEYKGIEYRLSWIPFGGYVAIPQLEPGDRVQTIEGQELPHAKPLDRIIVAAAGPLFNIIFGFLLGVLVWGVGYDGAKPADSFVIGSVQQEYLTEDNETVATPEAAAGLQAGDVVHKVNGRSFNQGWASAVKEIIFATNGKVTLDITRDGEPMQINYTLVPNPQMDNVGFPFIQPTYATQISAIMEGSPLLDSEVQAGDVVLAVNGKEVINADTLIQAVKRSKGEPLDLTLQREEVDDDGQTVAQTFTVEGLRARQMENNGQTQYMLGIALAPKREIVRLHPTPWAQFTEVISLTARTVRSLFDRLNPIRARNMGGPVMIVQTMTQSFKAGFMHGINLVVLITFSLAIVNLLPVPVLDGGHIVFGCVEAVARRRVPSKVALPLTYAFAFMIIGFMLYVTFHDIGRLIPDDHPIPTEAASPAASELDDAPPAALPEDAADAPE